MGLCACNAADLSVVKPVVTTIFSLSCPDHLRVGDEGADPQMKAPNPKEQMHRIAYTQLRTDQIQDSLSITDAGPICASTLSDMFAGKFLRIITDNGPSLDYRFATANRLSVSENGGRAIKVGYGALTLGDVVLISHMTPGTLRGYTVIVDRRTKLASVFEIWFGGDIWTGGFGDKQATIKVPREVQREVHVGYIDEPNVIPPKDRFQRTNRLEGRGYHWRQDNGVETLEFYPSKSYSNFVELTRFGGEMSFCSPSDYIQVDEKLYIYQRTECEFSGVMTLYVLDSNRVEQIGVRLGFDENDKLEYYMFRGKGEWLGQIAQYEPFGDIKGEVVPLGPSGERPPKGARRVFRPKRTFVTMTRAEVDAAISKSPRPFEPTHLTHNSQKTSDYFVGKTFSLRWDNGTTIEYRFDGIDSLRWRRAGAGQWQSDVYRAWESAPDLIMFAHLMTGAPEHDCQVVVADFRQGLATLLHGTMGTPYVGNEASVQTIFGTIQMAGLVPPAKRRHRFTNELVGRALTWNYQPGLTSMHLYTTPTSVSWIIFNDDGSGGLEWSGAASYVKIREGVYLAYWLEEASGSPLGTLLINMKTMHNCGVTYSCHPDGLRLSPLGAHSRHTGQFDTRRFFTVASDGGPLGD